MLSKIYEPVIIEKTQDDLEQLIAILQQELFEIRGETAVLNRDLEDVRTNQTSEYEDPSSREVAGRVVEQSRGSTGSRNRKPKASTTSSDLVASPSSA